MIVTPAVILFNSCKQAEVIIQLMLFLSYLHN